MTKEKKYQIISKIRELKEAPSCCQEVKDAAEAYLVAVGTTFEDKKFNEFIEEIKSDIIPVFAMVKFMSTPDAAELFGEEKAKMFYEHAKELEAQGAEYCDCPACSKVEEILGMLED